LLSITKDDVVYANGKPSKVGGWRDSEHLSARNGNVSARQRRWSGGCAGSTLPIRCDDGRAVRLVRAEDAGSILSAEVCERARKVHVANGVGWKWAVGMAVVRLRGGRGYYGRAVRCLRSGGLTGVVMGFWWSIVVVLGVVVSCGHDEVCLFGWMGAAMRGRCGREDGVVDTVSVRLALANVLTRL